jgi:DNA-binding CsgD family transcriptional regulator
MKGPRDDVSVGAMRARRATAADLAHCVPLLWPGYRPTPAVVEHLLDIWVALLDSSTFTVVEDLGLPFPESIEAFGLSVFVSSAFADEVMAHPRPYLPNRLYEAVLARHSPVLSGADLAKANSADGVDVLVLHFGMRERRLSSPRAQAAIVAGDGALFGHLLGYRIRSIANEVYGAESAAYMERGGVRLAHDFARAEPAAFRGVSPEDFPYLFLIHRDWMSPGVADLLSRLFHPAAPIVGFTPAEQRVLEQALVGRSDEGIAQALGVSLPAVKKAWASLLARAGRALPRLLPPETDREMVRGPEKRRFVLDYVRAHLEEVRPHEPSRTARRSPGGTR